LNGHKIVDLSVSKCYQGVCLQLGKGTSCSIDRAIPTPMLAEGFWSTVSSCPIIWAGP
jgi:hypothetical protein